ncbi:hypothetical protein D3C72_2299100 [compost metagenome]
MRHMAPERHEGRAALGFVAKRNQAAVTKRVRLDLDADDGGGDRCEHLGAGCHEQVEPEMAGAAGVLDQP